MPAWPIIRTAAELRSDLCEPAYAAMLETARANVNYWRSHFADDPQHVSGWGHNYVCPACAAQLQYNREQPLRHVCPACGTVAENTAKVCEAWVYYYRMDVAGALQDAAVLAIVDNDTAMRRFVIDTVLWYAQRYMQFDEHGDYAGRGRVMGQSLDEAVWGIAILRALYMLETDGTSDEGQHMHKAMFLPAARMVMAQSDDIHNISLWHGAFAVGCAALFEDKRLYDQAMSGLLGTREQVLQGFTADGIWYENSTTYHFYSLEAATNLCVFLCYAGKREPEITQRVMKGYLAFLQLGFQDGTLPCMNDGWKFAGVSYFRDQYLVAARLFANEPEVTALNAALAAMPLPEIPSRTQWLQGMPAAAVQTQAMQSVLLSHNCMAMLRSPSLEVFAKFGNLTAGHAHPDGLEISMAPWALDPGTTGYSSPLFWGWLRNTSSHSTFVVDGRNQAFDAQGSAAWDEAASQLHMTLPNAYPGVLAQRTLTISGGCLSDEMQVSCDVTSIVDWFFHGAGTFTVNGVLTDTALDVPGDGYNYLHSLQLWHGKGFSATWEVAGKLLTLTLEELPDDACIYVAETPDNPGHLTRHTVMVRQVGAAVRVFARFVAGSRL